jgi:hypothetical protein
MPIGTFTANLNSDYVYIDLSNLPSTVKQRFHITCHNQALYTLYFKIICHISDWVLDTPSDGKLGPVSAGLTGEFNIILTRDNPLAEATDAGDLTLEVYSDSGYTALQDSMDLSCTIYIEDLENWTNVTVYDFAGGSADGFTGGTVTNEVAIETGGYSYLSPEGNGDKTFSRASTPFPNNAKVRVCVYFVLRGRFYNVEGWSASLTNFKIQINSINQCFLAENLDIATLTTTSGILYSSPWLKLVIDASSFKNTSQLLSFIGSLYGYQSWNQYYCHPSFIIGRVVIAGKD